jgi:hypothetical protein
LKAAERALIRRAEMSITVRDQGFTKRRRRSICAVNEEASNVIAGLDPAIHLLARMMDTRVIKPAHDGFY